jgi:hypothetical protein
VARVLGELATPFVANQQPDALRKQQRGVLAPFGLRMIPGMQPSAARGKTAECVAKQRRAPDARVDKSDRQLTRLILRTASPVNRRNVAKAQARRDNR